MVRLLWTNLVRSPPTAEDASPYITMLDNGSITVGDLGVFAADLDLNADNINLVGLHQTGVEYIM